MEAAKGINPEITPEEIMLTTEVKEEVKEVPPKLRQKLHKLEATWERASTQFSRPPSYKEAPQFLLDKASNQGPGCRSFRLSFVLYVVI
jgi:hypothetical protein